MLNVLLNLALFTVKFIGGQLSCSVSVTSDAFNNLTDAGTTMFAWIGVKVASMGAGERHPNGHGRFEWIVALLSSSSIILIGWELLQNSVEAIKNPESTVFSIFTIVVLALSIGVKLYMFFYNRKKSTKHDSASLKAISADCLSDAVSTAVALVALLMNKLFDVNIDGWCGILVALFIMYNGLKSFGETAERIMGHSASAEDIQKLRSFAMENQDFSDMADIQIEDYGYGRFRVSMTAIGKKGLSAEKLLADVADLKYRIFKQYGYNAQITAELEHENDNIREYITEELSAFEVPLKILYLRVSDAGDYKLAELELGIDFVEQKRKNELDQALAVRFNSAPTGYKILAHLRLHGENGRRGHERHMKRTAKDDD